MNNHTDTNDLRQLEQEGKPNQLPDFLTRQQAQVHLTVLENVCMAVMTSELLE
jgi:hypothetical protein